MYRSQRQHPRLSGSLEQEIGNNLRDQCLLRFSFYEIFCMTYGDNGSQFCAQRRRKRPYPRSMKANSPFDLGIFL